LSIDAAAREPRAIPDWPSKERLLIILDDELIWSEMFIA